MSRFPHKEITVEPCICVSKHLNPNCAYASEQELMVYAENVAKEDVYKNLGNPEDVLELN